MKMTPEIEAAVRRLVEIAEECKRCHRLEGYPIYSFNGKELLLSDLLALAPLLEPEKPAKDTSMQEQPGENCFEVGDPCEICLRPIMHECRVYFVCRECGEKIIAKNKEQADTVSVPRELFCDAIRFIRSFVNIGYPTEVKMLESLVSLRDSAPAVAPTEERRCGTCHFFEPPNWCVMAECIVDGNENQPTCWQRKDAP